MLFSFDNKLIYINYLINKIISTHLTKINDYFSNFLKYNIKIEYLQY